MTERHILLANVFFAPFSYGGATIVAEQVAHALLRRGGYRITATSLCCRHDIAPYAVIKSEQFGITNYIINVPPGRDYELLYENPGVTRELADLMRSLEPDVVHAHCIQDMGTGILEAAVDAGVPSILSTHDFWWLCDRQFMIRVDNTFCGQNPIDINACRTCVEDFDKARARFAHLQKTGPLASVVTYPSAYARDLGARSGFAPEKGIVWENGIRQPGPDFFARQAARRARDPRLTFGFVGGPSHMKGWPLIRRAFADLGRSDFKVQLVEGSLDGSWWKGHTFDDLPGEWLIHPRFSQERMDDYYAEIDVLLFLSQWKETFGLAVREALARGVALIQTDSGGTTEHGTVSPDRLIPIGSTAEPLRAQLEDALVGNLAPQAPHKVASFDDQAAALDAVITRLLS